jgi:hypothetical protein
MSDSDTEARKKERSPSFPFISLSKAIERSRSVHEKYRKEPVRVTVVGSAWGLGAKSSGLLQTVAALKQYGLMEDSGSREDRKVTLTPLALRILVDSRPGQREAAIREAGLRPRLFAEYAPRWAEHRPADDHCISELSLDRGFSADAAKVFLRVFDETVRFADLGQSDDAVEASEAPEEAQAGSERAAQQSNAETVSVPPVPPASHSAQMRPPADAAVPAEAPFADRLKVEMTVGALRVGALLTSQAEVDVLVQIIQANKVLLPN